MNVILARVERGKAPSRLEEPDMPTEVSRHLERSRLGDREQVSRHPEDRAELWTT